ncbi:glycoside hydrolase family 113 [Aureispira anguillae]|uniref:GTA TIM-barrel-like domain-containing protein n=1 Tax=Aureispira anguillae TaxID=2864201 RepID=A0A915YDI9_9BACT|nr:hypothetical protein [Aureispira anguillae]BDS11041.1 hypothetical protein AsAng_0017520 [Aureispira anguillae]
MQKIIIKLLRPLGILFAIIGFSGCATDQLPCELVPKGDLMNQKIKGMSVVAAQSPIQGAPIKQLQSLGVDWIATLPYGYYASGDPKIDSVSCCPLPTCPHGPSTKAAVIEVIQSAHAQGMKVMVKPQLWSATEWVGELSFDTEAKWDSFEISYTEFIMEWVDMAVTMNAEMFCVGTEIAKFVKHRPAYWSNLIQSIRQVYTGQLTYAANWDDYDEVTFWQELDFIGVDAYFPLLPDETPIVCDLIEAWKPYKDELSAFSASYNKPILFTEFGYLSLNGCAYKTWELESKMTATGMNEQAQANALHGLIEALAREDWWAGGFQWKWYADAVSASCEQDISKDYTPEGKIAADVLKVLYE